MKLLLYGLIVFFVSPIPHELAHALVAIAFGYKIIGFHFSGLGLSFVRINGSNFFIGIAGGLANSLPLLALYFLGKSHLNFREQILVLFFAVFYFVYALIEGFQHL